MADFVAVIRKAVDGLPENSQKNREKVYEKARNAVRRQLENMSPAPAEDVVRRQLDRLEVAIGEVEIEHTEALPPIEEEAEAPQPDAAAPATVEPADAPAPAEAESNRHPAPSVRPPISNWDDGDEARLDRDEEPATGDERSPVAGTDRTEARHEHGSSESRQPNPKTVPTPPAVGWAPEPARILPGSDGDEQDVAHLDPSSPFGDEPFIGDNHDEMFGLGSAAARERPPRRKLQRTIGLVVLLLVVLGAAYAAWANRNAMLPLVASLTSSSGSTSGSTEKRAATSKQASASQPTAPVKTETPAAASQPPGNAQKANSGKTTTGAASEQAKNDLPPGGKFTERLMANGSETNPGPGPAADQAQQEGHTVSAQTAAATTPPSGQANSAAGNNTAAAQPKSQPAEISQKMYLYEERFKDQAPTASSGSVVWSLAKDTSDGASDNLPVIHGEISVPQKGITALITIKRNNDPSLPASHLIEIVFALPGNFQGGGIQNVQRVSMKETEQAPGNPLIAVPAKITDNFFMVALNDYPEAVKTNVDLLKSRNWMDIPITYDNGRRALITLEKGASGADVFDKALAAWAAAPKVSDAAPSPSSASPAGDGKPANATGTTPAAPTPAPNPTSTPPAKGQ